MPGGFCRTPDYHNQTTMKVTETSVSYSTKKQVDRFEPVEVSGAVTATVEDGEDPEEVRAELYAGLRDEVDRRMLDVLLEHKMDADGDDE